MINRAPSPYQHTISSCITPSPFSQPAQLTITTTFDTPNSMMSSIQLVPTEHISPMNGAPAEPELQQPWQRGSEYDRERPYFNPNTLPNQQPVTSYHGGPTDQQIMSPRRGEQLSSHGPVSLHRSDGALSIRRSVSSYHGGGVLPSTRSKAAEYHSRKKSIGYQPALGGDYPPGTPGGHYTTTTVPNHSSYYVQPQTTTRDPYNHGPSPVPRSPSTYLSPPPQSQNEQGMLPPPECFSRPPNPTQTYTQFDTLKIQDVDDLINHIPRMPVVLNAHDVYHSDWIKFMQDLSDAWNGRLPIPEYAKQYGRPPKRSAVAIDLVELWNNSFFLPRGIELLVYKGCERKNGKYAGRIDRDLPGFDTTAGDFSDSSVTEGNSEDDYVLRGGASYGNYGSVYGSQYSQVARNAEVKRKGRRRTRELEKKYSIYLLCH